MPFKHRAACYISPAYLWDLGLAGVSKTEFSKTSVAFWITRMVMIWDGTKACPGVKFATQTDRLNQDWGWEWLGWQGLVEESWI